MTKIKEEVDADIVSTTTSAMDIDISVKEEELTYEEKVANCSKIARPLASKKLTKKCYKMIKKANKVKDHVRMGLKNVQKFIRKGETGIVIFAGDVTPIEIMCHMPAVCEDKDIPYVYVPSKRDLGAAMGLKRGCLMVLIKEHADYQDTYNELKSELKHLPVEL